MTNEEMFQNFKTAIFGVLFQGKRSFNGQEDLDIDIPYGCLYRGPEGTKCAVGWLIPDDVYHPNLEGGVSRVNEKLDSGWSNAYMDALRFLQSTHDDISLSNLEEDEFRTKFLENLYSSVDEAFDKEKFGDIPDLIKQAADCWEVESKLLFALRDSIKATIAQGCRSMDDGTCVYRGRQGTKCALGHLIKDEFYNEEYLEGRGYYTINVQNALRKSLELGDIHETHRGLWTGWIQQLGVLQRAHDKMIDPENFTQHFIDNINKNIDCGDLPIYLKHTMWEYKNA